MKYKVGSKYDIKVTRDLERPRVIPAEIQNSDF